jgi:hypothetical protein
VARAGFGVPLILSHKAGTGARVASYSTLLEVSTAGYAVTGPEYLAAQALFGQNPRPATIKIGRGNLQPTQVYRITPTAVNSTVYTVACAGEGVTSGNATFTSDASATVAEITAALETALNAIVGANFTAVDDTTHLTVTGDAAADWFSLEALDPTILQMEQLHVDPGVATDLAAISVEDDEWYCLLTNYNSNAYVLAAVAYIEATKKIYLFDVNESEAITTTVGNSDTLDDIATANRTRTGGTYHPSPVAMNSAGWAGVCLPQEPGSISWNLKAPSGPPAVSLTTTQRANLVARNANFFQTTAGSDRMSSGTTGDGNFLDVRRSLDWLDDDLSKTVFENLAAGGKVPFTDAGVRVITSAIKASLQRAVDRGILAEDPAFLVTAPKVADVSVANKANRILPDVSFSGTLAGAIHTVTITGVVSV